MYRYSNLLLVLRPAAAGGTCGPWCMQYTGGFLTAHFLEVIQVTADTSGRAHDIVAGSNPAVGVDACPCLLLRVVIFDTCRWNELASKGIFDY